MSNRTAPLAMGSRARSILVCLLALVPSACMGAATDVPTDEVVTPTTTLSSEDLPVIQILEGSFDGEELTFRTLQPDELIARGLMADPEALAPSADAEDGLVVEPLVDLPSMPCAPSTCTGASYVAFSNVAGGKRAITNGAAVTSPTSIALWTASDVGNCGPVPTTGVCQQIRMRNLYTTQLERVYADMLSITSTGTSTGVAMGSPQPYAAPTDFGLNPAIPNGLFRAGEMGRSSPATGGQTMWWGFTGTQPTTGSSMTFTFLVQVRGLIVNATQRASIAALDVPSSDYPTQTVIAPASSAVSISDDGRFVAFAGPGAIYRKNMSTGFVDTVASGCSTGAGTGNPHLSTDGSVVVFNASICDLTGEGSTTTAPQVYAFDFNTSTMSLVSRSALGGYANGTTLAPRVSADGNVVVFQSAASNLIVGQPVRTCPEVYRFDRAGGLLTHVSAERFSDVFDPTAGWVAGCTGASVAGIAPDLSGDGNLVVFSGARPLDPADTNARSDVYVFDQAATDASGVVIVYRVSLTSGGAELTAGTAISGVLSTDGSYVAFSTDATNVIAGQTTTGARRHIYRRSSAEGADSTIVRVTRRVDDGEPSASSAGVPALSSSGRFVAFWSAANDLAAVSGVFTVAQQEVYVCDMEAPVAALNRCWVASTLQPTAASPFTVLNGAVSAASRIGFAYPNDIDAGYVAWQGAPTAGWGSMNGQGQQVFVSPVGDPRYQQPVISP